jgi:hypothetical protein
LPVEARRKAEGIHYTPKLLADYLAANVARHIGRVARHQSVVTILDPACGDGELLKAMVDAVPAELKGHLALTGFDTDAAALDVARHSLSGVDVASVDLCCADFLSAMATGGSDMQMGLEFEAGSRTTSDLQGRFDAVISNPPYVRTQVLGAAAAKQLAVRFGLAGRVDLYQAFVKAMTFALRDGAVLGLLTSNRFLTVQAGASMRDWLTEHFQLLRLVDLGDTKLFQAAVLPAILIARRSEVPRSEDCEFIRVYENGTTPTKDVRGVGSVLEALDGVFTGDARVNGITFHIETGKLHSCPDSSQPWSMTNHGIETWLAAVTAHSAGIFSDLSKVCVGIKTTADAVFIRNDWESLPDSERPEDELLYPLVTHHLATRWHIPLNTEKARRVLYPYMPSRDVRVPVDLVDYPRARAYLLKHRARLESRSYVTESSRLWYEIWVPHRPRDWSLPKIAFPDISETNKFFTVDKGWVVNGDCYWIKLLPGKHEDWLWLMLAVANSSFALKFYDAVFHNKLYSGRRRFMSQYVSRFPLPHLKSSRDILSLVPKVLDAAAKQDCKRLEPLQNQMDELVWRAFGLPKEVAR